MIADIRASVQYEVNRFSINNKMKFVVFGVVMLLVILECCGQKAVPRRDDQVNEPPQLLNKIINYFFQYPPKEFLEILAPLHVICVAKTGVTEGLSVNSSSILNKSFGRIYRGDQGVQ